MSHVRAQLRAAAVALLAALPATAGRVYPSRLRPLRDADLPCLLVHTDDEDIASLDIGGDVLERRLRLVVRACVKTAGALDDALDALISEVETALAGQTFGGLAKSTELTAIGIEMDDALEKPAGDAALTYTVTYYTAAGSPGTAL